MTSPTTLLHRPDRFLLGVTVVLVIVGFFLFSSASLGLLARTGVRFSDVAITQFVVGVCGGFIALAIFMRIPYRTYRMFAPYAFVCTLVLVSLVFVPGLGYGANGARRWLSVFGFSFQPAELLKVTFVLCLAWYFSRYHAKLDDVRFAVGGLVALLAASATPLLLQPDTGTFTILCVTGGAMCIAAGVPVRYLALLVAFLAGGLLLLALSRPYLMERVTTFLDPGQDPRGAGYQIKQSLIAIGSGGLFGVGFGQSVQKFSYLPEPIGDSIFSVAGEEFGFVGTTAIIGLFVFFAMRGLTIAMRAPDRFGGLIVVGIITLLMTQTFFNIGSMVGLMPLTGEPLVFISHGGTSLLLALASVGIILNVSRYMVAPHVRTV